MSPDGCKKQRCFRTCRELVRGEVGVDSWKRATSKSIGLHVLLAAVPPRTTIKQVVRPPPTEQANLLQCVCLFDGERGGKKGRGGFCSSGTCCRRIRRDLILLNESLSLPLCVTVEGNQRGCSLPTAYLPAEEVTFRRSRQTSRRPRLSWHCGTLVLRLTRLTAAPLAVHTLGKTTIAAAC